MYSTPVHHPATPSLSWGDISTSPHSLVSASTTNGTHFSQQNNELHCTRERACRGTARCSRHLPAASVVVEEGGDNDGNYNNDYCTHSVEEVHHSGRSPARVCPRTGPVPPFSSHPLMHRTRYGSASRPGHTGTRRHNSCSTGTRSKCYS